MSLPRRNRRQPILESLVVTDVTLETLMALSNSALVTTDSEQRITHFGSGAEATFGYTADEAVGQPATMLVPERLQETYRERLQDFVESTDIVRLATDIPSLHMQRRDGEEFPVEASAVKFDGASGLVVLIPVRDMTAKLNGIQALATMAEIINLSDEGVITLDRNRKITLFNPAAEQIFGYESQQILGQSYDVLVPPAHRVARRKRFGAFQKQSLTTVTLVGDPALPMLRSNGEEFFAELGVATFLDEGEPGTVVRVRDITEKLRTEEMRIQLRAAEESTELKSRLISMVSHELRSPLSAILGFTSLLIEYNEHFSDEERLEQLNIIEDSTRLLQRIVDDLLALSSLEAGMLEIQQEPVPLKPLLDSVLASLDPSRTHNLTVAPKKTGLVVLGDQSRLRQVLSNLIDNATKYSPAGSEIEIRTRKAGNQAQITVLDHGPGVAPNEVASIFEAFYRAPRAGHSAEIKGTGLGLALCRGFVEAHGGKIKAGLPEGGGLAVTFTLPLAP